jgi:NAD(P)-dependent dehydrogenase (short-subunit alcohol dehydrogenase family)
LLRPGYKIDRFRKKIMDLGIQGRSAIVCASSQGLGKGCALALAEAGASLVINGRNPHLLEKTAEEIRLAAKVDVIPVLADITTREGQELLLAACPAPDILVNNNGGPPFRDFHDLDRQAMLAGVTDTARLRDGILASAKTLGVSESEIARRSQEAIPAKRFGTPLEFGQVCAFLCSVHAGYITGQNILLDGGLYPATF